MSGHQSPVVWLVEDDPHLRGAMERSLAGAGVETAGFESAESFLEWFDAKRHGCVVLDVCLRGGDGLRLQRTLRERGVMTPVLFVSGHADLETAVRAMKTGAIDFLRKPFGEQDLLAAVRRALDRDAEIRDRLVRREAIASRRARLTRREDEVLELLVADLSSKEIAARLGISPRTVDIHRQRVMHKMEASSVAGLVRQLLSDAAQPDPEDGGASGDSSDRRSG